MEIKRNGQTFSLTAEEIREAHSEYQHELDILDMENELELSEEIYAEKYETDTYPVTSAELVQMAAVLRRILDKNADACWSQSRTDAATEVLEKRKQKWLIPISWTCYGTLEVEAVSLDSAIKLALADKAATELPEETGYDADSLSVCFSTDVIREQFNKEQDDKMHLEVANNIQERS